MLALYFLPIVYLGCNNIVRMELKRSLSHIHIVRRALSVGRSVRLHILLSLFTQNLFAISKPGQARLTVVCSRLCTTMNTRRRDTTRFDEAYQKARACKSVHADKNNSPSRYYREVGGTLKCLMHEMHLDTTAIIFFYIYKKNRNFTAIFF